MRTPQSKSQPSGRDREEDKKSEDSDTDKSLEKYGDEVTE